MAHVAPQRVLSDTCLSMGPEVLAEQTPGLSQLSLSYNPIDDVAALKPLVRAQAATQVGRS